MSTIQDITIQVRQVLIETNDGLSRHELYSRFVNECNQLQLSEEDFYKTVLKAAHKSIDWTTVEEEYKKKQAQQQATTQEQAEKAEAIANAPVFIDRLVNLSFDAGTITADALKKIFDKAASLGQSSNALALRINEKLEQQQYRPFPQANLDAVTLKEILLSTNWYSPEDYPKPDSNGPKRRINPLLGIIIGVLLIGAIVYGLTKGKSNTEIPITNITEVKKETPVSQPARQEITPIVVSAATTTTAATDSTAAQTTVAPIGSNNAVLTDEEIRDISGMLNDFYTADNNEDIDAIVSYFKFPVDRYYDAYTVDETTLRDMFNTSFGTKLLSHSITVDWNNSQIAKTPTGYLVTVKAEYVKVSQKEPDVTKTVPLNIIIKMNSDKKITSIYANKR